MDLSSKFTLIYLTLQPLGYTNNLYILAKYITFCTNNEPKFKLNTKLWPLSVKNSNLANTQSCTDRE